MSVLTLLRYMFASRPRHRHAPTSESETSFIDVHSHYLPPSYVAAMKSAGIHEMDGWPIPNWSPELAIETMDAYGIAAQVVSLTSPGVDFLQGTQAIHLARTMNEYLAEMIQSYSPRFGGFAVLPLPDMPAALEETRYALDDLALDGIGLFTNYNGIYLGDSFFDPVFAELDRRGAVVFIHPTKPPNSESLKNTGVPTPIMEYPFETTRMATNLVQNDVPSRFPNVRWIVTHGGGTAPYIFPRLMKAVGTERVGQFRSLYYDLTATSTPGQSALLCGMADPKRLLMGFDFPFMDVSTIRPVIAGLHLSDFSRSLINAIRAETASSLFPQVLARLRSVDGAGTQRGTGNNFPSGG
jgi:aminocarboxymuconate-semialdehyde decarboxylase